jgi:hypothetical protein
MEETSAPSPEVQQKFLLGMRLHSYFGFVFPVVFGISFA